MRHVLCARCLRNRLGIDVHAVRTGLVAYECPTCTGTCPCAKCARDRPTAAADAAHSDDYPEMQAAAATADYYDEPPSDPFAQPPPPPHPDNVDMAAAAADAADATGYDLQQQQQQLIHVPSAGAALYDYRAGHAALVAPGGGHGDAAMAPQMPASAALQHSNTDGHWGASGMAALPAALVRASASKPVPPAVPRSSSSPAAAAAAVATPAGASPNIKKARVTTCATSAASGAAFTAAAATAIVAAIVASAAANKQADPKSTPAKAGGSSPESTAAATSTPPLELKRRAAVERAAFKRHLAQMDRAARGAFLRSRPGVPQAQTEGMARGSLLRYAAKYCASLAVRRAELRIPTAVVGLPLMPLSRRDLAVAVKTMHAVTGAASPPGAGAAATALFKDCACIFCGAHGAVGAAPPPPPASGSKQQPSMPAAAQSGAKSSSTTTTAAVFLHGCVPVDGRGDPVVVCAECARLILERRAMGAHCGQIPDPDDGVEERCTLCALGSGDQQADGACEGGGRRVSRHIMHLPPSPPPATLRACVRAPAGSEVGSFTICSATCCPRAYCDSCLAGLLGPGGQSAVSEEDEWLCPPCAARECSAWAAVNPDAVAASAAEPAPISGAPSAKAGGAAEPKSGDTKAGGKRRRAEAPAQSPRSGGGSGDAAAAAAAPAEGSPQPLALASGRAITASPLLPASVPMAAAAAARATRAQAQAAAAAAASPSPPPAKDAGSAAAEPRGAGQLTADELMAQKRGGKGGAGAASEAAAEDAPAAAAKPAGGRKKATAAPLPDAPAEAQASKGGKAATARKGGSRMRQAGEAGGKQQQQRQARAPRGRSGGGGAAETSSERSDSGSTGSGGEGTGSRSD